MTMGKRKKEGVHYSPKAGRIMEYHGYSVRIHWSPQMLAYLRRHYATTLNEELAGCLGVSPRTMIRKARELGLEKDPSWLRGIWDERRLMAHAVSRSKGYPGSFRKGVRNNPEGEFKPGHRQPPEVRARHAEALRLWYRRNPQKARQKAKKAWETRRSRKGQKRDNT